METRLGTILFISITFCFQCSVWDMWVSTLECLFEFFVFFEIVVVHTKGKWQQVGRLLMLKLWHSHCARRWGKQHFLESLFRRILTSRIGFLQITLQIYQWSWKNIKLYVTWTKMLRDSGGAIGKWNLAFCIWFI